MQWAPHRPQRGMFARLLCPLPRPQWGHGRLLTRLLLRWPRTLARIKGNIFIKRIKPSTHYLKASPVPRCVSMSGPLQVSKLDLISSIWAAHPHRELHLQKLMWLFPVHLETRYPLCFTKLSWAIGWLNIKHKMTIFATCVLNLIQGQQASRIISCLIVLFPLILSEKATQPWSPPDLTTLAGSMTSITGFLGK